MLDSNAFGLYLKDLTPDRSENVLALRQLLLDYSPVLSEEVCSGKWYTGLLTYKQATSDFTIYALGPLSKGFTTFHMMPYYMNPLLHERHGSALKAFLSGKSCIKFKRYSDLPEAALRDIISGGLETVAAAKAALERRKK